MQLSSSRHPRTVSLRSALVDSLALNDMASDAPPTPVPVTTVTTEETATTFNELWQLFTQDVETDTEMWILEEIIATLTEKGIRSPWQLKKAPDALLLAMFPLDTKPMHYITATHVRDEQRKWDESQANGTPGFSEMAAAIHGLTVENKAARQSRKRSRSEPDTDDERAKYHNHDTLRKYSLDSIPVDHLPDSDVMAKMAKRGAKWYREFGNYFVPGPVTDYPPTWLEDPAKDMTALKTHAHWVASWWGRAFAQLSAQGHAEKQTVSLTDLLREFLNANQVAVESSNKVGWEYDRMVWSKTTDRVKRQVPMEVKEEFLQMPSADLRSKIWKKLNPQQSSDAQTRGANYKKSERATSSTDKGWGSKSTPTSQSPSSKSNKGGKGGGKHGKASKGKGGGKAGKHTKVKAEYTPSKTEQ